MNAQEILENAKNARDIKEYDEAESLLKSIDESMGAEEYAEAIFLLGEVAYEQNKFETSIKYHLSIREENSHKWFAYAQYKLGFRILDQDYNLAKKYLLSISPNMDIIVFNESRLVLGASELLKYNSLQEAIKYFDLIKFDLNEESKLRLRNLIILLWISKSDKCFDLISKYATQIPCEHHTFEVQVLYKISVLKIDILAKIYEKVSSLRWKLRLTGEDFGQYGNIAHYTESSVGIMLLDQRQSPWRFSATSFMNDPKEGKLLDELVQTKGFLPNINSTLSFASCFSFNHNSLNQFRLYGKKDKQEYSGVSLVIKDTFFNQEEIDYYRDIETHNFSDIINKQSIYRCIYVDPESGYLRVARRSKVSFYRSKKTKDSAQEKYNQYVDILDKIDEKINTEISDIKDLVVALKERLKDKVSEEQEQVWALVNDILLPLRYLIKHAAFEEEEECRMIYITDMCDPKIKSDPEKKWLYVEYAEPVKDHIKKVYLGDGAKDYRPFFERALADKSKVKDSNNPFRI